VPQYNRRSSKDDEAVFRLTRGLAEKTGAKNLCLAGGVALNCVANGKVLRDGKFENIWIQPAAGDAGGAVGAALAAVHLFKNRPRTTNGHDGMYGSFLGPSYSQSDIEKRLTASGARFTVVSEDDMIAMTAQALADQHHLDDDRHFPERGVIAHLSMGERRRLDHLQRA
jgi:carbamoyltransferase